MRSLRGSARRYLGFQPPMTVRGLARELGVPPRTVTDLLDRLDQEQVTYNSGSLTPSSVKGSASLTLCSDGHWAFTGHVHENSFVKHKYVLAAAPKVALPGDQAFVFHHHASVSNSRDSDFTLLGHDFRIAQHWDELKTQGVRFKLEVNLDVGDIISNLLRGLIPVAIALAALLVIANKDKAVVAIEDEHGNMHYYGRDGQPVDPK